jgi:Putative DNA-binding domain
MRKSWPMSIEMPSLLELQLQLRRAVLGGDPAALGGAIRGDGLDPVARLRIYRNHAFATLGAVLEGTFPVVCRLVDKRFFVYAANEYLRERPPNSRCLVEYGADFGDFLAGFEPCRDLPYLADVARFEWALHMAAMVREATPLPIETLAAVPPEKAADLAVRLQPSVSYFASGWPIDTIWQANQQSEAPTVDLALGGTCIEIRRAGDAVAWRRLDPGTFAFRTALAGGLVLVAAAATAGAEDPTFDLAAALDRLFGEGLAVGFYFVDQRCANLDSTKIG